MGNFYCAACGTENPHSTVKCGKYGAYICMKHCIGCKYFSGTESPIWHCCFKEKKAEEEKRSKLLEMQTEEQK